MSKPVIAEPCPSEGGERISQDHIIQVINALDAHDATGSGASWDGCRPSGLSFERHTITNETTFPWCIIGKIYTGKDPDFNNLFGWVAASSSAATSS